MTEGGMIAVISILSLCCIIEFVFLIAMSKSARDYEKSFRAMSDFINEEMK